MYTKAIDLKEFYQSVQGRVVRRVIRHHLKELWSNVKGQRVLGVGFATPYLKQFIGEADRVACMLPMQQGAIFWPRDKDGLVTVCDEGELPIETNSIDKLVIVHALNSPESIDAVLKEVWRVLVGQGRLIIIVPNRSGIWARIDTTPFGHGAPYSMGQIRHFLKEYNFVPEQERRALFFPPTTSRVMLALAPIFEKIGHRFFNAFGGVNIVESSKQLYAGTLVGSASTVKSRKFVTAPGVVSSRNSRKLQR